MIDPLKLATRALSRVVNPHGQPGDDELRAAVDGKVVLVTGASYGIGEAAARQLGAAGATVIAVARTRERLDEVCAAITEQGGIAHPYPADLTDPESVDELAKRVLAEEGHVDVIVSNAGKSIRRSIALSYDRFQDFERTIDVNYLGPVKLLLALLPAMRERGQGHIVNVSTWGVLAPPAPRWAAYQASKAAFDTFLRSAAPEIAEDGVTTTSIYMTLVRTRMSAPTPELRNVPSLSAEDAGGLICKAIVERPKAIRPWWAVPTEAWLSTVRGPVERVLRFYVSRTDDTRAAMASAGAGSDTASGEPDSDPEES